MCTPRVQMSTPGPDPLPLHLYFGVSLQHGISFRARHGKPTGILPEKREVTGSTPVPTTGNQQVRGPFNWQSVLSSNFRALRVP